MKHLIALSLVSIWALACVPDHDAMRLDMSLLDIPDDAILEIYVLEDNRRCSDVHEQSIAELRPKVRIPLEKYDDNHNLFRVEQLPAGKNVTVYVRVRLLESERMVAMACANDVAVEGGQVADVHLKLEPLVK